MNIVWFLHWLVPLSVILLPLLPKKYLYYVFWYPMVYYIVWLAFGGCPINSITKIDETNTSKDHFLYPLMKKCISPNITEKQYDLIIHFILTLSIVISGYRLLWNCESCRE